MTACWKKWMKTTLKLDRMTFLNYFQHPLFSFRIPFYFFLGFVEKYKWRSKGAGNIVKIFNTTVKLEVWKKSRT